MDNIIPAFVEFFPKVKLDIEGLDGWTLKCQQARVAILKAHQNVLVPRHHHNAQWGIVLDGEMELTIGDETTTYRPGDCHFIPAGVEHEATLYAGWTGLYIFPNCD